MCVASLMSNTSTIDKISALTDLLFLLFLFRTFLKCGPDSSVGIATGYGLEGPGSNPGGDEIFRTCPCRPWGPHSLLYNGYRAFPGVECGRGVTLTPHPLLMPRSKNSRDIPLLSVRAFVAYKKGETYPLLLQLFI
jgi:hypothetical protein